jgi:hypothetical protein
MKRLVGACLLIAILAPIEFSHAQTPGTPPAGARDASRPEHETTDSISRPQENLSSLPSIARNAAFLSMASHAESGGDATRSLDFYQQAYDAALRGVDSSTSNTEQRYAFMRQMSEAGYYLAWGRYDQRDRVAGDAILGRGFDIFGQFEGQVVPPRWRLALARLHWLKARIAQEDKDSAGNSAGRNRVLALTADRKASPDDYGPLSRLRIAALWHNGTGETLNKSRRDACKIAAEIDALVPGVMTFKLTECDNELARQEIAAKRYDAAGKFLASAEARFAAADRKGRATAALEMLLVNTRSLEASIAEQAENMAERDRKRLSAARMMIKALKRGAYSSNSPDEISSAYSNFQSDTFDSIPEYVSKTKNAEIRAEIFGGVGEAIEASRKTYPKSRYLGLVSASANGNAAMAYLTLGKPELALVAAERAVRANEESGFALSPTEFSEDGLAMCRGYSLRSTSLLALKRLDDALAAYRVLSDACRVWLRQFPYDFYARSSLLSTSIKLGGALADAGRESDAVPLLKYSSDWGSNEASRALAAIYRRRTGDPEAGRSAAKLTALADGQNMKRFTVPVDFSGVKYPFHLYVSQFADAPRCPSDRALKPEEEGCVGFVGIDDQVTWLKEARGGVMPKDVTESFQKLDRIARERNISFPDLTVYALGAANKAETGATEALARAIRAEMDKAKFRRNPMRWLDSAGLALSGYDPVSYTQGPKPLPGKAQFFALWDGALWLFSSAQNRDRFVRDAARFAPQYGGYAATKVAGGEVEGGDAMNFALVDNKLFLFGSTSDAAEWRERAKALIPQADAKWADLYPGKTDIDSTLAGLIVKIAPVELQGKFEVYYDACKANRQDGCAKMFEYLVNACSIDKSIPACEGAIAIAESSKLTDQLVSLLGNRSWYYALDNKPDEAVADARRALGIDAEQPWIHGNLANGLLMKGEVAQAIAIYKAQKGKPGPGEQTTMCPAILDDIGKLLDRKLITREMADRVRRAIVCK